MVATLIVFILIICYRAPYTKFNREKRHMYSTKRWSAFIILAVSLGFISPLFADSAWENFLSQLQPVVTLNGGAAIATPVDTNTQSVAISPAGLAYHYTPQVNNWPVVGMGGVFAGAEYAIQPDWWLQSGFSYYAFSAIQQQGSTDNGPGNYHYNVQSQQVLWESRLAYHYQRFNPYFSVGLGTAINKDNNYQVTHNGSTGYVFSGHQQAAFSWQVGVGMDANITQHWRAGLSYRFVDLGANSLGTVPNAWGNNQASPGKLKQDNLYMQEALAQVSYLF